MLNNEIKFEQAINKGSFIELSGKRAAEVAKYWKVEILQGENKELLESVNYAIKITSTLNEVSLTVSKRDLEDNVKNLVRRLNGFGVAKPSYIKVISESVNEALYTQQNKINKVSDIGSVWVSNISSGVPACKYYRMFYKHFMDNPDLFPTRSSNKYQHKVSHGVILDNKKAKNREFLVAIRSGELKKLFSAKNDIKYHGILESLVEMGVLEGEIQQQEIEIVEEIEGDDEDDSYSETRKSAKTTIRTRKKGFAKRKTMNTMGKEASVFILNIDPEKGEQ